MKLDTRPPYLSTSGGNFWVQRCEFPLDFLCKTAVQTVEMTFSDKFPPVYKSVDMCIKDKYKRH